MHIKPETKVGLFVLISILIFAFMAVHLGVLRFYLRDYKSYTIYFDDLNGLDKKADVKIAGVKVGWIESIKLVKNGNQCKIKIMVLNKYKLYEDASVEIQQDGLLGTKFLVVHPGMSNLPLRTNQALNKPLKQNSSIEDLMSKFEKIANNIQDISASLKDAIGDSNKENQLKSIIENVNEATKKITVFTDVLSRNENNLDQIFNDLKEFTHNVAPISKDIHRVADIFDNNVSKLSLSLNDTLQNINSIVQKIDQGQGCLGKLINEVDVYNDIKMVTGGFRGMSEAAENIAVVVDSHSESMLRKAEHYNHPDSKGYIDFRLFTQEDLFYMFQIIGSEKGTLDRTNFRNKYFNEQNKELNEEEIKKLPNVFSYPPFRTDTIIQTRNTVKYGLQIGKIFKDLALRIGMFENTVGFAIDYQLPFGNDNFRWVTSLEVWDLRGQDRINDRRPHLKWLNRVYFLRNLYLDFGADDFVSRENANAFFGFGVRFSDDDVKYLISKLTFWTASLKPNS